MGPTRYGIIDSLTLSGGKSFLLRGDETKEKGLILQYLEDLLDGNEISRESGGSIYSFRCSIYGIYQNNIIDFLSPKFKEKLIV
jgi:Kinesin motor domain